jgi:hypothetical protein
MPLLSAKNNRLMDNSHHATNLSALQHLDGILLRKSVFKRGAMTQTFTSVSNGFRLVELHLNDRE